MKRTCVFLVILLAVSVQPLVLSAQEQPAAKADDAAAKPAADSPAPANTDAAAPAAGETKKADETPAATTEQPKADATAKTDAAATAPAKADATTAPAKTDATATADPPAEPVIACTVKSVSGSVEWRPSGDAAWQALKAGDSLSLGADICTGFRAKCMLLFMDESSAVEVQPMTILRIGEFERSGNKVRTRLYVQRGTTKTIVEKSRFESDFAIVTPEVTLAVRGTKVIRCSQSSDMGFKIHLSQSGAINVTGHQNQRSRNLRPNDNVQSGLLMAIQNVNFGSRVSAFDTHGGLTQHEQFSLLNRPGAFFGTPNQNAPNGNNTPLGNPRQQNIDNQNPNGGCSSGDSIIHEWEYEE